MVSVENRDRRTVAEAIQGWEAIFFFHDLQVDLKDVGRPAEVCQFKNLLSVHPVVSLDEDLSNGKKRTLNNHIMHQQCGEAEYTDDQNRLQCS